MYRQFQQGEPDEELMSLAPTFDETALSTSSQKRIRRSMDMEATDAIIKANRMVNRHKVAMVAMMCQGQIEDAVTVLLSRNPRRNAAENLFSLAQANAEYLYRTLTNDYDSFWRW